MRHGESEHHINGLTGGWNDTPLTELGRQQISATAAQLRGRGLSNVGLYCSDLQRAMESASIIESTLGCTPVPMPKLRELNNGDAAGMTLSEAARIQNPEPKSGLLDWRPYTNAETWREMTQRTASALANIQNREVETAIVVGHGNFGQALIQTWLKLPLQLEVSFRFDVASITELRTNDWDEREIVRLNSHHA
ncbi:MAG: histidine phosphatase family protein [SAR202 cluster bacterium]|nr:histidine phosphatase family protein [SAR202 cluster bacterium]